MIQYETVEASGVKILVRHGRYWDWRIATMGHEKFMIPIPPEKIRFLDIGAFIGSYSLRMAPYCSKIVAVEPMPEECSMIEEGAKLNGFSNITVERTAVAAHEGHCKMSVNSANPGSSRIEDTGSLLVPLTTIDSLWAKHGPFDIVKVDIEGFEIEALKGAPKAIAAKPTWYIEVHAPTGVPCNCAVCKMFKHEGYRVGPVDSYMDDVGHHYMEARP